ncbi:MAG: hypothetical protein M5R40_15785 [Anaerolineae bacterium]|nr:hypothetical protein [Anaerolineae bacterium]
MTTLIAVYDSEGCRGRCDARCYNAKGDKCTCVCGGMNHGAGPQRAMQNTQDLAEEWITRYSAEHDLQPTEVEVMGHRTEAGKPRQLSMLPLMGEAGAA